MATIRLLQRGQLTLPAAIRDALKLEEGSELLVHVTQQGDILLHPLEPVQSIRELRGAVSAEGLPDVEKMVRSIAGRTAGELWSQLTDSDESPATGPVEQASTARECEKEQG